mmetsp:Transcript_41622/g.110521  ORF Transcript_41622/g.110521 Transcript_41622/m.110521 type:complete len:279 (+) Transcript_41622:575-1411(+)
MFSSGSHVVSSFEKPSHLTRNSRTPPDRHRHSSSFSTLKTSSSFCSSSSIQSSSSDSLSLSSLPSSLQLPLSSAAAGRSRRGACVCRGPPPTRAFLPNPSAFSRAVSASAVGAASPPSAARAATSLATSASSSGRSTSSLPERLTTSPSSDQRSASCTCTCLAVSSSIAPTHRTSRPSSRICANAARTASFFSSLTRNCSSVARSAGSRSSCSRADSLCSVSRQRRALRIASRSVVCTCSSLQPSSSSPPPAFFTFIDHLTIASRAPTRSRVLSTLVR